MPAVPTGPSKEIKLLEAAESNNILYHETPLLLQWCPIRPGSEATNSWAAMVCVSLGVKSAAYTG